MLGYTAKMNEISTEIDTPKIISVSELNKKAKSLLENGIPKLWIEGEISNLARPASGHMYFSLKDESSQIRCAWFKQRQLQVTTNIANGSKMLALGKVSLYGPRGEYQFIIEKLEMAGEGDLKRKYEELRMKLAAEGIFAEEKKLKLPTIPNQIGVITSPSGAAIRDILSVLKRRFPITPIIIFPVAVQGDYAAPQIANALKKANFRADCDLLILARGGGSLEDLWAFNEEIVARAIDESLIPIISAVGHETDVTISDFASDYRAPTPSGAAEIAVPDQQEWIKLLQDISKKITALITQNINTKHQSIDWLTKRFSQSSPKMIVKRQIELSFNLKKNLHKSMQYLLMAYQRKIEKFISRCIQASPQRKIQKEIMLINKINQRIHSYGDELLNNIKHRTDLASKTLHSVSPLRTLDRGYAIARNLETKKIITDPDTVKLKSDIEIKLAKGKIKATVTRKEK